MNDMMIMFVIKQFLNTVTDAEIRSILENAHSLSSNNIDQMRQIFITETMPVPHGFSEEDVNIKAPSLFSDVFYLNYIQNMSKIVMNAYTLALANVFREDIRQYYKDCLASTAELFDQTSQTMLLKGVMVRSPHILIPKEIEFVQKQSFFTGWFGERRRLHALEIGNLFFNIQRNALGKSLLLGFSQVSKSNDVRNYLIRGKNIVSKHIEIFSSVLTGIDFNTPMIWDAEPTSYNDYIYSDKLIMFHTTTLISTGITHYATGLATSTRDDISAHYVRFIAEIADYVKDGANIMIDNGWLEQPPVSIDREALSKT
jgi:hypothetical protein